MPHKLNANRRAKIPKQKHRVTKRAEYNEGLRRRRDVTAWINDEVLGLWSAARRTTPGGQPRHSDLAIELCLTLGMLFKQPLRQTQGFIRGIAKILGVEIAVPDFSTLSRRGNGLILLTSSRADKQAATFTTIPEVECRRKKFFILNEYMFIIAIYRTGDEMNSKSNDFSKYREWDKRNVFHPWEGMEQFGDKREDRNFAERAAGIYVYDEFGKQVIDGPAGMWCMQLGYGRTDLVEAMADQATKMAYCSPFSESNSVSAEFAHEIAKRTPGDLNTVYFTTCGSTAVDIAIRFVHFRNNVLGKPNKKKVISRQHAYHGGTYLSASLSGKPKERVWLDTADDICHFLPDVNPLHRAEGQSMEAFLDEKVSDLENAILDLGPENVALFIAEPVLASGGVIVPPEGYHKRCLDVCRKHDVLYHSDEVVTAFGRCGHWFASEDVFGIRPDIITIAKGMTSGMVPMGAAIFSDRLLKDLEGELGAGKSFAAGYTYTGHPVCASVGLKNIEIFEAENVLEHVRDITPYFQKRLRALLDLPAVVDARGVGLIGCVECSVSKDGEVSKGINETLGEKIDAICQELGLNLRPIGNLLVFSPPLVITKAQINDLFDILEKGIAKGTEGLIAEGYTVG